MWSRPISGTCSGSAGHSGARPPEASDTILGRGWASQGHSAAQVDPTARGVGLLLQEGGVPVRLRACYLNDLDLAELARRAEHQRGTTKTETPTLRLLDGTA